MHRCRSSRRGGYINQRGKKVIKSGARQRQIEAQRSEGGVHSKTMDDDEGSICRSHSKPFVTFLPLWLIIKELSHGI